MQPLQPIVTHPPWGSPHRTGVKIEGCANAQKHASPKAGRRPADPPLLLRAGYANPDEIRTEAPDHLEFSLAIDIKFKIRINLAHRGAENPGNNESGVTSSETSRHLLGDAGPAAIEVVALPGFERRPADPLYKVGSGHSADLTHTAPPAYPYKRRTIGND